MDYPIYKRNNDGTQLYKILSLKKVITLINDPNLGVGFAVMDGSSLIPVQSIIDNFDLCTEDKWLASKNKPEPLHLWNEYHRAKEWLKLLDTVVSCTKLDAYQIKEWTELTERVFMWEEEKFNHL